jgi:glycosyltransferase involved in cell wall biosynthesis
MKGSMAGATRRLVLNGGWTSHHVTGTERYAEEVAKCLVDLIPADLVLALPANGRVPGWWPREIPVERSSVSGLFFDQLWLPLCRRGRFLVTLAGRAPLLVGRQAVLVHDATPMAFPSTFDWKFRWFYAVMFTVLSRRARLLFTVSNFSARELAKYVGGRMERYLLAPCGHEHVWSAERDEAVLERAGDAPFFLVVGSLAPHKNVQVAVDAAMRSGVRLLVVGPRPETGGLRPVQGLGRPGGDVEYLGRVSDAELFTLYEHAEALIFPSLYEGFGLPLIEAQALGCPVISSTEGALSEVGGSSIISFPARSAAGLAAALSSFGVDGLREDLQAKGRANAARFSWRATAATIAEKVLVELDDAGLQEV